MLNKEQESCVSLVKNGHNVCILGQGGTGKSLTIRNIVIRSNLNDENRISLTCYTGVACLQFKDLKATTLHKFAGLEDGRHSKERIAHLIQTDERFESTLSRIRHTELLIIDEVSMVSKRIFEAVEHVCRVIKDPSKVFGGIQLIISGDFYQLPPIKDELYGDNGDYCFNSKLFSDLFPHIIELSQIFRQNEPALIKAVHELECGTPSQQTNDYILSLTRPLTDIDLSELVKLHARNYDVDLCNYQQLQTINNQLHLFEAVDRGDMYYLNRMLVQKHLGVKVGAKVMLLRNLDEQHVNGSLGIVVAVSNDYISVDFDGTVLKIGRYTFSKFDPVTGAAIASRHQFPLKLAYSVTIHTSQGMSLPLLEVDCKHAVNPGQIGVAVGRAVTSSGLRIVNYSPNLIHKHPQCVYNFYDSIRAVSEVPDPTDCCKHDHEITAAIQDSDIEVSDIDSEDELISDLLDYDRFISVEHSYSSVGTSHADMTRDFEAAIQEFLGTPSEEKARKALKQLLSSTLTLPWYSEQLNLIQNVYRDCFTAEEGKYLPKHFTGFYSSIQEYLVSEAYTKEIIRFNSIPFSSNILTSVVFVIQSNLLRESSERVPPDTDFPFPPLLTTDTAAGQGKIRYVGGYCVAKCRYCLCSRLRNCLYKPGMEPEVENMKQQVDILDNVIVSATELLKSSKFPETLKETERKQNERESLTNITDDAFKFFQKLEVETATYMKKENLHKEKKSLYKYVLTNVKSSTDLLECFIKNWNIHIKEADDSGSVESIVEDVCSSLSSMCCNVLQLFEKTVQLFITVIFAQFRKDYLRVIQREKGTALRKKVLQKTEKKSTECVTMQSVIKDSSASKKISHFQLKAMAHTNANFFLNFKKDNLVLLLRAYGHQMPKKSTKKELGEKLHSVLVDDSCTGIIIPSILGKSDQGRGAARESLTSPDINLPLTQGESRALGSPTSLPSQSTAGPPAPLPGTSGLSLTGSQAQQQATGPPSPLPGTPGLSSTGPQEQTMGPPSPLPGTSGLPSTGPLEQTIGPPSPLPGTSGLPSTGPLEKTTGPPSPLPGTSGLPSAVPGTVPRSSDTETQIIAIDSIQATEKSQSKKLPDMRKRKNTGRKRTQKGKRGGKGKKLKSGKSEEYSEQCQCPICGKFYVEAEEWICCDACANWSHRVCVGVEDDDWTYFSSPDAVYMCPMCQ